MTDQSIELQVKALLKGKIKRRFEYIKDHYGLTTDAEAIRLSITDSYKLAQLRESSIKKLQNQSND